MTECASPSPRLTYAVDLDNTLNRAWGKGYDDYVPYAKAIKKVNALFDAGHHIKVFTGRGSGSGKDWQDLTIQQLAQWGVRYHELILGKPAADVFIDDKALNVCDWLGEPEPQLIAIVGAKGTGKSTLRQFFEGKGFAAIKNEDYYVKQSRAHPQRDIHNDESILDAIYREAESDLRSALTNQRLVVYEATGTNPRWHAIMTGIKRDCNVWTVKVTASQSDERLHKRDNSDHYLGTGAHIAEVKRLAQTIEPDDTLTNDGTVAQLYIQAEGTYRRMNGGVLVATGGGFDPVHVGHIELFERSRQYGTTLAVILNTDNWLVKKKGYAFMPFDERKKCLEALKSVDVVIPSVDTDSSISETIKLLRPNIYTKGGDRHGTSEQEACDAIGCKLVSGLGAKIQSSSKLVESVSGGR